MVTSHDVARLAGVSQPTVSRALRDSGKVSEETKRRVRQAAKALGYVPSETGRALSSGRTRRIGLLLTDLENQFYPHVIAPMHHELEAYGYQLVLQTETTDTATVAERLISNGLDGVLLATTTVARGTNTGPDAYGWNYSAWPSAGLLAWWPSLSIGSYTGQSQAAWSLTGTKDYLAVGGEFPRVNGVAQQGLVRFAKKELSPNGHGPSLFNTTYPLNVSSTAAGTVRINWNSNHDIDNDHLTYRVYRDVQLKSGLVYETRARASFCFIPFESSAARSPRRSHRSN